MTRRTTSLARDDLATGSPPPTPPERPHGSEHFVQFYEEDSFLVDSVGKFIGTGLREGEACIIIATADHRAALEASWTASGLDLISLRMHGRFIALDADQTLARFMANGLPDEALFKEVVGTVVLNAAQRGRKVRAFGEMVAQLWAEGKTQAAILLEELWNDLGKTCDFSLCCAYPMRGFASAAQGEPFRHVCQAHTRVLPAESYVPEADSDDRLRAVSLLQQKATSLEAETAERKNAQGALIEHQNKLAMAVAVAQLGVWELDLPSGSLHCSDQSKVHFGFGPDEPTTLAELFERVHPGDRPAVDRVWSSALTANQDYSQEFRVSGRGGEIRWLALSGRCFHNGSHRMLGVSQDVTVRHAAAALLEQTVAERTEELQATIGDLEAFSYSISHDMRAPLRSMHGYADILINECGDQLSPECRHYLERITASASRMDRMIQDVLSLSRVGRTELKLEAVSLDHLLRGIIECYPYLQPPQAEIIIEGDLPRVLGNAAALTQCLSNLLGNAVKFVAPGTQPSVRIWAELCYQPPESGKPVTRTANGSSGSFIRLFIQDNGIGIPKEAQDKVFGIFQRLSKNYEGTGIGLAIVKKAAERMGGRVGISSERGPGSTFWLELKAAESRRGPGGIGG